MLRRAPFESHLRALRTHVPAAGRSISSAARAAGQRCASVNGPRFPITAPFNVKGHQIDTDTVLEALRPLITDERAARIERAVSLRTFNVLPIVEGAYDMGNLSAVCRSADAFGMGAVHAINGSDKRYKQSQRTAAGADKWLHTRVWDSTSECLTAAKGAGFQIVATHLSKSSVTIPEVDWTRPTAFILGNEKFGISDEAVALADATAIIPMSGFVESFNISVAAALIMYEAQQQRIRKQGRHADLTAEEQRLLTAFLMLRSVRNGSDTIAQLIARPPRDFQKHHYRAKAVPPAAAVDEEVAVAGWEDALMAAAAKVPVASD